MLLLLVHEPARSTLFPYTTLFRSIRSVRASFRLMVNRLAESRHSAYRDCSCATRLRLVSSFWSSCRARPTRSEEHTSELQSHSDLVCRLLLEKKKHIST